MKFIIYYDAYQEAKWFQNLSPYFRNAKFEAINQTDNPEVTKLLRYDKPDIILIANGKATLSLEKTTEVPTGHNIGQRFGRVVCAAEEGVLGIYFGPFLAKKHGRYASKCWINIRQLQAMLKLKEFHKVPSLAVNWPSDNNGELIRSGKEVKKLSELITSFIKSGFSFEISEIGQAVRDMEREIKNGLIRHKNYNEPPDSARIIKTERYKKDKKLKNYKFPSYFFDRQETLHYRVGMKAGLRSDPFTGTQLVYDYIYCRKGPTVKDRIRNLVMEIPDLKIKDWEAVKNPDRKDKKLLKEFPDLLLLRDGYV